MKDTLDLQKFYPEEMGITEVTQNINIKKSEVK